jgi:hypothetical protein
MEAIMEKKIRAAKKKSPLIRDLKKIALNDLSPDQTHVIMGGAVYTCGGDSDDCQKLTVIVMVERQEVVITKARAKAMKLSR